MATSNWAVPKDENGKAYYSYRKVTYWVNSTENYKYIIKGDLDYRPDIIEDKPVPVASEFTDWKTGIKYIMRNDGWAILPGSGGGGGDITRAEVVEMDAEVLRQAKEYTDSKPAGKTLVAGENITIVDGPGENEQTISARVGGKGWDYIDQLNKIEDYLYQLKLMFHDYEYANNYFKSADAEVPAGSCTTINRDGYFARNYDWTFDSTVEFIYNVDYVANVRRSSLAMIGGATQFSKSYIEAGVYGEEIKLLPFFTTDGVNDAGVRVSTHVINNDGYGTDDGIVNPTVAEERELASLMIPRFVLDTFTSATNAVNYIMQNVKVYHPAKLLEQGYLQTFVISDDEHSYILEPWNGEYKLVTNKTAVITNFEWWHTTTNDDGTLYTNADIPEGKDPGSQTNSQHGAMGVERYNLAFNTIKDLTLDVSNLKTTMKKLNYTRLYDSHPNPPAKAWLSDYITSDGGLTADGSLPEAFDEIREQSAEAFTNRDRETGETWQTVHSAIYDWANKKLYLSVQEQDSWYEFNIPWIPGDIATVDYVDAQDSATLGSAKDYADETKSAKLDAGDNITLEELESGHIKVSSTATGGDITKAEVQEMIAEALVTAKGYADEAQGNAKEYTDGRCDSIAGRVKSLEDWKAELSVEDLDYVLDDDTTVTIPHLTDPSAE